MNKLLTGLAALTLGLSTLGLAQDTENSDMNTGMTYGDFDTMGSGQVDSTQFSSAFSSGGFFTHLDADASGTVSQDELGQGLYSALDTDNNGSLSQQEFDDGMGLWMADTSVNFTDADTDANGEISQDEFTQAFDSAGLMTRFDTDTSTDLTEEEFSQGVFGMVDTNADMSVDETEFNDASGFFRQFDTE